VASARSFRTLLATAVAGALLATGLFFLWRKLLASSIDSLVATAYSEHRTLDLRIPRSQRSELRITRGQDIYPTGRPQSLLEAEVAIARGLRAKPDDPVLLVERGNADLLEWSYEAAISDMQQALDTEARSPVVLNGLATAYFERAEAENRFVDYATAYDLQSRALRQSPEDTVILFNRAITAARLFLFDQSIEDFRRYLTLEPSQKWATEAAQRLSDIKEIVASHDKRTTVPLLSPAEFAQRVNPSDPGTWANVEPRIEDYLSAAITEWLPEAFPLDGSNRQNTDAKKACQTLGMILETGHGDRWLKDLLAANSGPGLARAFSTLSAAIKANSSQDYGTGLLRARESAESFSKAANSPGRLRANFEVIYALHFSDAASDCLNTVQSILHNTSSLPYMWLRAQSHLEQSVCMRMQGDLGGASRATVFGYREADSSHYSAVSLRAIGFWAADLGEKGQKQQAWNLCKDGLGKYWSSSTSPVPGYNLYVFMDELAESDEPWLLETAIDQQALTLLPQRQYPLWAAFECSHLAKMAARAGLEDLARASLASAERLFAIAPTTQTTENVRLGSQIEVVELSHLSGAAASLNRLRAMNSQIEQLKNFYVASDYFKAIGDLEFSVGQHQESEEAFEKAVTLLEEQRASLASEDDRISWSHQSSAAYRELVDSKLQLGDYTGALAAWEIYHSNDFNRRSPDLRSRMAQEADRINSLRSTLDGSAAVVYVFGKHGIFVWTVTQEGVKERLIEINPSYVKMLANRFSELCSSATSSLASVQSLGRQLYKLLVAPVEGDLVPGQPLMVEADETLSVIPFQALIEASGSYLSDRHPIVYSPALRFDASAKLGSDFFGQDALLVASDGGEPGLRPLPDALSEVQEVAKYFPNSRVLTETEASLLNVLRQLPKATVFHFAGHAGMVNGKKALLLATAISSSRHAFDSDSLKSLPLSNLRLAVLSACSTENGVEGNLWAPESLAQSLLRRGVPHVIATRWNIDSTASRIMMQTFYAALASGRTVAQSIADAEASVRKIEPHPYYWAGFDTLGTS
jgi:CHAT domain-containing protein